MLYHIFKPIVRLALRFYFRPFQIIGAENIPKGVPVILAPNHQNAFMDPIIPASNLTRIMHFLARADVFKKGLIEKILYSFHIWPVYRLLDGKDTMGKNEEIFNRCSQLLQNDGMLLLFPEGFQVVGHRLRSLKKGLARIAFQTAEATNFEKEIYVVPVGINYEAYSSFDTGMSMRFGEPVKVLDFKADYEESKQKGLQTLTQAVHAGMAKVVVHVPDHDDEKFWFHESNISSEKLISPQFFADLNQSERPAPLKPRPKTIFLAKLLHWPVLSVLRHIINTKIKSEKFVGSIKFLIGMFLFPLYYLIIICLIGFLSGNWLLALGTPLLMMLLLKIRL